MHDRPMIFAGLLIFVGLFTFPLWYAHAGKTSAAGPDIKLPTQEKQCVAPLNYMRNSHMQLLLDWREQVVRADQRQFTSYTGKVYDKSLTRTCLTQCHTNKAEFCDRCHTYAGVSGPYCWECHIDTKLTARSTASRSTP
jgi:hypothetical protein